MTIQNVLIAIAMEQEAQPFIDHLGLKKQEDFFPSQVPFHAFQGTYKTHTVTVVTNGKDSVYNTGVDNVGTVPAALCVFLALQKLNDVDLVINAGTSGGFRQGGGGAEIGDAYLTTGVAHHDRRIPIPGFDMYGIGRLTCHEPNVTKLAEQLGFKTGVCTTGNSLDKTEQDEKLMESNNAAVKDMEAAAIAWTCALFKKPWLGLKVVTDIVDGDRPAQEEFLENLSTASKSLQAALPKLLDAVCDDDFLKSKEECAAAK